MTQTAIGRIILNKRELAEEIRTLSKMQLIIEICWDQVDKS